MRTKQFLYGCIFVCITSSGLLFAQTKLNDIQILATHNSFKLFIDANLKSIIELFCSLTDLAIEDYQHLPLKEQLDKGVRGFELDIFADPQGGRYREFLFLSYIGEDGQSHDPDLDKPGFKVMHDVNFDFNAHCHLFKNCLSEILEWSKAHPNHLPIFIHVQVRDEPTPIIGTYLDKIGLLIPISMTTQLLDALDQEIRSSIPSDKLVVPDQVRGNFATLRDAVLANAWPSVKDMRGHFIFYMDASLKVQNLYLEDHPQLSGRVIFTTPEDSNADDAAFLIVNDPKVEGQKIRELVTQGFIVRTRADSGTVEAYQNDTSTRQAALLSGAQLVSTDFVVPEPSTGNQYHVFIPDGHPGRCNPIRKTFCQESEIAE